ncbi:hypothetical protein [Streptosporangium sp. OZ121]|uniref:hypothetical protein n=1 Tax=Streptosporangium sp. OZ121 TaxID=3444183 RepID=UPI003F7AF2B3
MKLFVQVSDVFAVLPGAESGAGLAYGVDEPGGTVARDNLGGFADHRGGRRNLTLRDQRKPWSPRSEDGSFDAAPHLVRWHHWMWAK